MTTATVPEQGYREVPLSRGLVALVDAADYGRLAEHKWTAFGNRRSGVFYACRFQYPGKRLVLMHREVMGGPDDHFVVDHRNHDTLDNRKANLRLATRSENQHNMRPHAGGTSRYKGVSWDRHKGKWRAAIGRGRGSNLGAFVYERNAARAHDAAALERFGDFAWLNADHFDLTGPDGN